MKHLFFTHNHLYNHSQHFQSFKQLLKSNHAKILVFNHHYEPIVCSDDSPALFTSEQMPFETIQKEGIYLGVDNQDAPFFACSMTADVRDAIPSSCHAQPLQKILPHLESKDASILAHGRQMLKFRDNNRFCSKCGTPMTLEQMEPCGPRMVCHQCLNKVLPEVQPVVQTLVVDPREEKALLVRKSNYPKGLFSCPEGRVEPGESLEKASQRIVFEETGIELTSQSPQYCASQSWLGNDHPQMMIGFIAETSMDHRNITIQHHELEEGRWCTLECVEEALSQSCDVDTDIEEFRVPAKYNLAHHLIHHWQSSITGGCMRGQHENEWW